MRKIRVTMELTFDVETNDYSWKGHDVAADKCMKVVEDLFKEGIDCLICENIEHIDSEVVATDERIK